jgi:integrase
MIKTATNLRDQTLLTLLSDCGCRVSELLAVSAVDFDSERQIIIIPHLKRGVKKHCPKCSHIAGRSTKFCAKCGTDLLKVLPVGIEERTRMISIGRQTSDLLDSYLIKAKISGDMPIFPITRQTVYLLVRESANLVGLGGRIFLNTESGKHHYIHPHDFRSALAVDWLAEAKGDVSKQKALQDHLGHKKFETTISYNKLAPSMVRATGDEVREKRFGSQ